MAKNLNSNKEHFDACYERWGKHRNRDVNSPEYVAEWDSEQCFSCNYYIPLSKAFSRDCGACSNPDSKFDGVVMLLNDGCEKFTPQG
ncbi:MAG: DUF3027 domain-containing protein [Candidatus Saccharibacteria bacterium]